jgi:hypothetical protein
MYLVLGRMGARMGIMMDRIMMDRHPWYHSGTVHNEITYYTEYDISPH